MDLHTFLADVRDAAHSGVAHISGAKGVTYILFYQGRPILASRGERLEIPEALDAMGSPDSTLSFYLLGDELAHAFSSVLEGERVWDRLSVSLLKVDKMLTNLMEGGHTGHICVHLQEGADRHFFFKEGRALGIYNIGDNWRPLDITSVFEEAEELDQFRSRQMESLLSVGEDIISNKDILEFISSWNRLLENLGRKMGKKPVEKSLRKHFGEMDSVSIEELRVCPAIESYRGVQQALEDLRDKFSGFLDEMAAIVGSRWIEDQLEAFEEENTVLLERLSLDGVFSKKGD